MNKEDHFIDTDKLGDVLLEFSKKISRFSQNIPDTLFGSLTEFLKNIPDDVKNTQLFANVQKLSNYDLNYEDVWWLVDSYGLIDKEDAEEELMEYYEQENKLHCYIKSIISNPSISEREKLVILLSHIEPLIYNTLNYTKQPYSKVKQIVKRMSIDENEGMSSESVGKLYVMGITYVVFANTDAYTKEIDKSIPFRNNILHNGIVEYGTDDIHSAYELLVEFISMLVFIKNSLLMKKRNREFVAGWFNLVEIGISRLFIFKRVLLDNLSGSCSLSQFSFPSYPYIDISSSNSLATIKQQDSKNKSTIPAIIIIIKSITSHSPM